MKINYSMFMFLSFHMIGKSSSYLRSSIGIFSPFLSPFNPILSQHHKNHNQISFARNKYSNSKSSGNRRRNIRQINTKMSSLTSASTSSTLTNSAPWETYTFQQTMIRIKDPAKSLPFYEEILGFKRLHEYHFSTFSLYFLYTPTQAELDDPTFQALTPGSKEAETYLWSMKGTTVELTHNHGSEIEGNEHYISSYESGNVEPNRGFGHLAIATNDVYKTCEEYERQGVTFQKKPNEGNMKGLAFLKDPDGYWIEVISREAKPYERVNLAQTMLRIKDPIKSLEFYCTHLGLIKLCEKHFPQWEFSLYFLSKEIPEGYSRDTLPAPDSDEAYTLMKGLHEPVLELTHNHGTEKDENFKYCNGNVPAGEGRGFGHIGFLVKGDLEKECAMLEVAGYQFQKKPSEGSMRNLAFVLDPDGYWVELIQEGASFQ